MPTLEGLAPFQSVNQIKVLIKLSVLSLDEGHSELPFWGHIAPRTKSGRYSSQDPEPSNRLLSTHAL